MASVTAVRVAHEAAVTMNKVAGSGHLKMFWRVKVSPFRRIFMFEYVGFA